MSVEQILAELPESGGDAAQLAIASLKAHGFPDRRAERWKYTRSALFADYAAGALAGDSADFDVAAPLADWHQQVETECFAVFVGGEFDESLSALPDDITLEPLDVAPTVGTHDDAADALVWLNAAARHGQYQLRIQSSPTDTLHCVFLPRRDRDLAQVRLHIDIAAGAELTITDHIVGDNTEACMHSIVTSAAIGESATLSHTRVQQAGANTLVFTRLDATLAANARSETLTLDRGGKMVRNELNLRLDAAGATAILNGVYLANDRQHIDNHTHVDHTAPDTVSRENYRGILRDRSRCVFNGKVMVHEGADGTDAAQSNANLLLSDHAEIDTKPELEIYADDVKCAHGATVGQLDPNSLFYLRARGVDADTATQLLTYAFCREATAMIKDPVLQRLSDQAIAAEIPRFTALELSQ